MGHRATQRAAAPSSALATRCSGSSGPPRLRGRGRRGARPRGRQFTSTTAAAARCRPRTAGPDRGNGRQRSSPPGRSATTGLARRGRLLAATEDDDREPDLVIDGDDVPVAGPGFVGAATVTITPATSASTVGPSASRRRTPTGPTRVGSGREEPGQQHQLDPAGTAAGRPRSCTVPRSPGHDRHRRGRTRRGRPGLRCHLLPGMRRRAAAVGHARPRRVRDLASTTQLLRPRRARCTGCGTTHVLLPGAVLPRRADTTTVIGTALGAGAAAA